MHIWVRHFNGKNLRLWRCIKASMMPNSDSSLNMMHFPNTGLPINNNQQATWSCVCLVREKDQLNFVGLYSFIHFQRLNLKQHRCHHLLTYNIVVFNTVGNLLPTQKLKGHWPLTPSNCNTIQIVSSPIPHIWQHLTIYLK